MVRDVRPSLVIVDSLASYQPGAEDNNKAAGEMMRRVAIALVLLLAADLASAVEPGEMLKDPALEARARAISQEIRCLVCQNQSIDDSNADLAHDLRVLVRERLTAGDSDRQILAYLTSRYGDYVLLRPPVKPATWLLWFGPPLLLAAGLGGLILAGRRRRSAAVPEMAALNDQEQRRLVRLMQKGAG